ncbi:50S ribosomal protein L25 [Fimbriiglobus ruber]|uniref:Large ribosomal subunit protein bL25 n=1 Tax=Fimbriiglobus ruber TaxID=1908690 RepID=A0A225DT46_9BACT|nr:50S ribosomal protein L25 [Fimbriiglobus ruber]OWK40766.1 LSU ribosomal protein L25p [Fimbriiglobus ruber]
MAAATKSSDKKVATLTAQARDGKKGSRASAKLRKQGLIPAIVYGHKEPVAHVSVNAEELDRAIRVQHARMFSLTLGGKTDTVLIKELQWDHLGKEMIHVDFERRSLTEIVKVVVPVELRNAPKATGGGVLDQPLHHLHVECEFAQIPDAIRIDLTNLTLGHPIHVKELTLPEGVKVLEGPEAIVVQLKLPGAEAVVAEASPAEPEVLTAKKPKEGEAEEK